MKFNFRNKINWVFSIKASIILMFIFSVSIATATFIENKYDTSTADILIYNAKWFEILFLLIIINFIGGIKLNGFLKKEKIPGLIFHSSFIIIIIGAAITRNFGWDGEMRIEEGSKTNVVYVSKPVLISKLITDKDTVVNIQSVNISMIGKNYFEFDLFSAKSGTVNISYKNYVKNVRNHAVKKIKTGKNIVLSLISKSGEVKFILSEGDIVKNQHLNIAFNNDSVADALHINTDSSGVFVISPYELISTRLPNELNTVSENQKFYIKAGYILNTQKGVIIQFKGFLKEKPGKNPTDENRLLDKLVLNIFIKGQNFIAEVYGQDEFIAEDKEFNFSGTKISFAYGFKSINLPFDLFLKHLNINRYPGSSNISDYSSNIILNDKRNGLSQEHTIAFNKVLNYNGYRFFQLSFNEEEKASILSVNYDYWGTKITYLGYFLLCVGLICIFFNKNSRFRTLLNNSIRFKNHL